MSKIELAIKFGSNEIIIYRKGIGIIARQTTYVATSHKSANKIYAYGDEAKRLCDIKPNQYKLYEPIKGIDILNQNFAQDLLKNIINNAVLESGKIVAVVAIPCALTEKKLLELKILLHNAGISKITFVQNAVCIRSNLNNFDDISKIMVVDMGKYLVDMSVLTKYDFVDGRNYLIGGAEMDTALATYIEDNYDVIITEDVAETIKNEIASMYKQDLYTVDFKGLNKQNEYQEVTIRSNEARIAIIGVYDKIFDLIEEFIESLSPDTIAEVRENGIVFTGGVSCIYGLAEYANKRLNIPIYVVNNPKDAVILGAGKLLSLNKEDYSYIKI